MKRSFFLDLVHDLVSVKGGLLLFFIGVTALTGIGAFLLVMRIGRALLVWALGSLLIFALHACWWVEVSNHSRGAAVGEALYIVILILPSAVASFVGYSLGVLIAAGRSSARVGPT